MLPPRQLQAHFPCSVQAFSCYSTGRNHLTGWGLGMERGAEAQNWASTYRDRENPGLTKGYLVPVSVPSGSAKPLNQVHLNPCH